MPAPFPVLPFFIQSKLADHVIDMQGNKFTPGTQLDAFTKSSSDGWDNQLWQFVAEPDSGEAYYLQNPESQLVIGIKARSAEAGALLTADQKIAGEPIDKESQLWIFVPSEEAGYYFIQCIMNNRTGAGVYGGGHVIDVQGNSSHAGALLDAFTQSKTNPGWSNQLWKFVDTDGASVTPPATEYWGFA